MQTTLDQLYSVFLKNRIISTDSRAIKPGCLFFALKGENFDGNTYATSAIDAGAAYAVIDDPAYEGRCTLLVDDVLGSLQQLARRHRNEFKIPVIAITGSNGKTTTKELLCAVLSQTYHVTATKGNLNNHIGVPLTLLSISGETEIAIVEMGANHQGEIKQLCNIAQPTNGIITNIGRAHLGGFGGYQGVIKAKNEMYKWLRLHEMNAFVNCDNSLLMELSEGMSRTLYGESGNAFVKGKLRINTSNLALDLFVKDDVLSIQTNLTGNYNFENVLAAICVGYYFDVPTDKIAEAISLYTPSNSRSQSLTTANNSVILDAYNANPSSMLAALENFRKHVADHKMVILGDMLELGEESAAEHRAIVNMVKESGFEKTVLVGPDFTEAADNKFPCFPTSDDASAWLGQQMIHGFSILIKGSRGIKMEKVLKVL